MRKSKIWSAFKRICERPRVRALTLAIPMLCAGCRTNTDGGDFCLIYAPVHADYGKDTAETLWQIDWNNAAFDALCK